MTLGRYLLWTTHEYLECKMQIPVCFLRVGRSRNAACAKRLGAKLSTTTADVGTRDIFSIFLPSSHDHQATPDRTTITQQHLFIIVLVLSRVSFCLLCFYIPCPFVRGRRTRQRRSLTFSTHRPSTSRCPRQETFTLSLSYIPLRQPFFFANGRGANGNGACRGTCFSQVERPGFLTRDLCRTKLTSSLGVNCHSNREMCSDLQGLHPRATAATQKRHSKSFCGMFGACHVLRISVDSLSRAQFASKEHYFAFVNISAGK